MQLTPQNAISKIKFRRSFGARAVNGRARLLKVDFRAIEFLREMYAGTLMMLNDQGKIMLD